jgi:hypothetical protein
VLSSQASSHLRAEKEVTLQQSPYPMSRFSKMNSLLPIWAGAASASSLDGAALACSAGCFLKYPTMGCLYMQCALRGCLQNLPGRENCLLYCHLLLCKFFYASLTSKAWTGLRCYWMGPGLFLQQQAPPLTEGRRVGSSRPS